MFQGYFICLHIVFDMCAEEFDLTVHIYIDWCYYTVSGKRVTPCIHFHNSGKQCQTLIAFWIKHAMSNCKQITKFE